MSPLEPFLRARPAGARRVGTYLVGPYLVGPYLVGLALCLVSIACSRSAPEENRFADLAGGVFVDASEPVRVGRVAGRDLPNHAMWEPVPIAPVEGWQSPTRSGWHPYGERARLLHYAWGERSVGAGRLRLDLRAHRRLDEATRLTAVVGGLTVGSERLEEGYSRLLFEVPADALEPARRSPVAIDLLFDPPLPRGGRPPVTLVGLALGEAVAVEGPLDRPVPVEVDAEAEVVRLSGNGTWVVPLEAIDFPGKVTLEVRCTSTTRRVALGILDRDGERLAGEGVDLEACRSDWVEVSVGIDADLAGWGTLEIEAASDAPVWDDPVSGESTSDHPESNGADSNGAGTGIEIRRLRYPSSNGGDRSSGTGERPAPPRWRPAGKGWPDVVVVILDAARADHFGAYGYARDTTPRIDRIAAEGLVFEHAYSECPNTSCSIPNLITGVPFMNLGTVFHGKKLPNEVVTLAEYLKPLGYRTIGLSANPNNSVSRNAHQGFDYFERLWGAHRQADLAVERIAAQPPDEPLYLQLHLLPPHQPYMPEPEFDLFTDPDYRGPVHPKVGLRKYTSGAATFTPADLEQLIALYDGNLRMGDDAVGQVVDALRASGRWERTLFVVTADHGEAFGEHGDFQHNSTLFDEMLHVPLVMRLPGGVRPAGVATAETAALADVVPTVLGYLGLVPRPEVWGSDLLVRSAERGGERLLFHRTSHRERPLLAVRGRRWKAITGMSVRTPMLFDLRSDPDERSNVSGEQPAQFASLAARLRDFLADWEERVPQAVEDVELEPEEIELLRSLGYVE